MTYAKTTEVTISRTRDEIEKTLSRYGATGFMFGWEEGRGVVAFKAHDRHIRFVVPIPGQNDPEVYLTPTGKARSKAAREAAVDQIARSRWRALLLIVKAKLEYVSTGMVTFEEEFALNTVLPSGQTVGEYVAPQIAVAYEQGSMPSLLPGAGAAAIEA